MIILFGKHTFVVYICKKLKLMIIDKNILFEMVFERNTNYKNLKNKYIDIITEEIDNINFVFFAFQPGKIRQVYSINKSMYNNKLRNKKLNSL